MAHAAFNLTSGPIPLARCDVLSSFATDDAYQARIDGGYRNPLCVNVVGPMLVGTIMNAFGLGMIMVLASVFFSRTIDMGGRRMRQMTAAILILNVTESIILVVGSVQTIAAHFGQMPYYVLFHKQISNLTTPLFEALLIFSCEIFLALRCLAFVRALAPDRKLTFGFLKITFVVGICGAFGMRLGATAIMWRSESLLDLLLIPSKRRAFATLKTGGLLVNGAIDVLLATTMSLECHKAKSDFRSSNQVLQSLITTMVGGGVLLVLIQLWAIVLFFIKSAAGWSIPPTYILGQAYSVCFFYSILRPRQAQAAATAASASAHNNNQTANGSGPATMYNNPQGEASAATLTGMMDDQHNQTLSYPDKVDRDPGRKLGHKRARSASFKWRTASGGFKRWSTTTLAKPEGGPPPAEEEDAGPEMTMEEMFSTGGGWVSGNESASGRTTRKGSLGTATSSSVGAVGTTGPSPRGSVGSAVPLVAVLLEEEGESRFGNPQRDARETAEGLFAGFKGMTG